MKNNNKMNNRVFLEFISRKSDDKLYFEGQGRNNKETVENDNCIEGSTLYDGYGNKIGNYREGIVDYNYDEGKEKPNVFYGKWCASAADLSRDEAAAILSWTENSGYKHVKWAKKVLCLNEMK